MLKQKNKFMNNFNYYTNMQSMPVSPLNSHNVVIIVIV